MSLKSECYFQLQQWSSTLCPLRLSSGNIRSSRSILPQLVTSSSSTLRSKVSCSTGHSIKYGWLQHFLNCIMILVIRTDTTVVGALVQVATFLQSNTYHHHPGSPSPVKKKDPPLFVTGQKSRVTNYSHRLGNYIIAISWLSVLFSCLAKRGFYANTKKLSVSGIQALFSCLAKRGLCANIKKLSVSGINATRLGAAWKSPLYNSKF